MTAHILDFPSSARLPRAIGAGCGDAPRVRAPGAFPILPRRREYDFAAMRQLLALDGFEPRTAIDKLRALADQCALPLPSNPRTWKGRIQRGSAAICAASRWDAMRVDAWLDAQQPPPTHAAALPAQAQPERQSVSPSVRADLRRRAKMLRSA